MKHVAEKMLEENARVNTRASSASTRNRTDFLLSKVKTYWILEEAAGFQKLAQLPKEDHRPRWVRRRGNCTASHLCRGKLCYSHFFVPVASCTLRSQL